MTSKSGQNNQLKAPQHNFKSEVLNELNTIFSYLNMFQKENYEIVEYQWFREIGLQQDMEPDEELKEVKSPSDVQPNNVYFISVQIATNPTKRTFRADTIWYKDSKMNVTLQSIQIDEIDQIDGQTKDMAKDANKKKELIKRFLLTAITWLMQIIPKWYDNK